MLSLAPIQLLDDFLLDYDLAHALLLLLVLALPVGYIQGSRRITAINLAVFGAIFIAVPSMGAGANYYAFLGVALLILGPMLYATAER